MNREDILSAARYCDVAKLKALIAAGADLNARSNTRSTPLINSAEMGNAECAKALLAAGADVNARNELDETALMMAAKAGVSGCVQAILDAGADANARNFEGWTALMWAAGKGDVISVNALIAAGADVNSETEADWQGESWTALRAAASESLDVVKILISARAKVRALGSAALRSAASAGKVEIVELLIASGADVNARNANGETALMKAVASGRVECVKILINAGAELNAKNNANMTAFQIAADRKSEYGYESAQECMDILSTAGAESNWEDKFAVAAEAARKEFEKTNKLPANKQYLTKSENSVILYFRNSEERDTAFNILASQFQTTCEHLERRRASNSNVMYEHWIVTNAYTVEMQRTFKASGCDCPESQSVDYWLVLSDSDECF